MDNITGPSEAQKMNTIRIQSIRKEGSRLEIDFSVPSEIQQYFKSTNFFADYSIDISDTPDSIAIIPLMVQVLPISWVLDCAIEVEELDEDFFNSIIEFKAGYIKMYPCLDFQGELIARRLIANKNQFHGQQRAGAFFSGGVDAFATLIAHAEERPLLISVMGADIHLSDQKGWSTVVKQNQETADLFKTELIQIRTNFREFLNHEKLNNLVHISQDNWWHGFQHGIGLLGLASPVAYCNSLTHIYIASSYTASHKYTCASDPTIDNFVKYCGCRIIHDQYEYERLQKTQHICEYVEKNKLKIFLRVCYHEAKGENCCKCEKCIRTATAIQILGKETANYGFKGTDEMIRRSKLRVIRGISPTSIPLWQEMVDYVNENDIALPKELQWIKNCDFEKARTSFKIRLINFICRKMPVFERIFG